MLIWMTKWMSHYLWNLNILLIIIFFVTGFLMSSMGLPPTWWCHMKLGAVTLVQFRSRFEPGFISGFCCFVLYQSCLSAWLIAKSLPWCPIPCSTDSSGLSVVLPYWASVDRRPATRTGLICPIYQDCVSPSQRSNASFASVLVA